MPAFNAQSFYHPSVAPDTGEGWARGISTFGSGIASGISKYKETKRDDAQRAESRQWQLQDRQSGYDHESTAYEKRRRDALSDDDRQRSLEEDAMKDDVYGHAAAIRATYGMDDATTEALKGMKPRAAKEFLNEFGKKKFQEFKDQHEIDQAIKMKQAEDDYRKAHPQQPGIIAYPPDASGQSPGWIPSLDGKPMGGFYPTKPQAPPGLTDDQFAAAIQNGGTVSRKVGGDTITYRPPGVPKRPNAKDQTEYNLLFPTKK